MHDLRSLGSMTTTRRLAGLVTGSLLLGTFAIPLEVTGAQASDLAIRADSARAAFGEGRLPEAARLLADLTSEFPEDGGLHWLYAQVLGAAAAADQAHEHYRRAMQLAPGDPWLRLEFGRVLVEDGRSSEGKEVLDPVRGLADLPAAAAEAETLTGLAEYWDGDLSTAEVHLGRALDLDSTKTEASAALRDVRVGLATSITTATSLSDDDQPLQMLGQLVEVGFALGGRARGSLQGSAERRSGNEARETTLGAAAGLTVALPGGRVAIEGNGGAVRRGADLDVMPIGKAGLSVRAAAQTFVRFGIERAPYLWTVASLDTAVAVSSLDVRLDRAAARTWAGEAGLRLERFPDGNVVRTLSAWLLAPAYVARTAGIRLGYAGALQDSRSNTFRTAGAVGPPTGPPTGPPGEILPGVYVPYYTPEEVQSHSLILEGRGGDADATSLRVTAVYAAWASELAPAIIRDTPGRSFRSTFTERSFTPWTLRAELSAVASDSTSLMLSAEHRRTAFYSVTRVGAGFKYRFTPDESERR